MRFDEIPRFTRMPNYRVNVSWAYLEEHIKDAQSEENKRARLALLDLEPDFQRAHVWTPAQQTAYVEYILRGGFSGKELYFNCTGWQGSYKGPYVIVDGKQRLEAARAFLRGDIKAFGYYYTQIEGKLRTTDADFVWCVNDLPTRKEVLQWYLDLNTGGVVHTQEELDKVRDMLKKEK